MAAPDISGTLQSALKNKFDFTGAASFHCAYADAPNPGLVLSDLGPMGLPLNAREAQMIKSRGEQAPFGMAERTVVDTSVRDTWQLDATLVAFQNPAWSVWLQTVVEKICRTLGVNHAASRPSCEFYKLLLYETGLIFFLMLSEYDIVLSKPNAIQSTEKANGMFATMIVVLPSLFTGGATHLSHGSTSATYDCSTVSNIQTSVMAWYTDVMHEVKPITGGYRLALAYNLIHTTTALRPALSGNDGVVNAIRKVLMAWKDNAGSGVPEKILYLLDHKYSQANLRGSALKGEDAQRVAILDALGQELGFRLGLASVECHVMGGADDDRAGYHGRGRYGYCHDSEESESDDDALDFMEVSERSMSMTNFVDLDGQEMADEVEIEGTTETIPADLEESVTSGDHDEQEYEGYMGNGGGTLERWYRRTVLIIWPRFADCVVMGNSLEDVCDDLKPDADGTAEATPEQCATIEFLLGRFTSSSVDAVLISDAVCYAACRWGDLELWKRVVDGCSRSAGLSVLDVEVVCTAIKIFGIEATKPSLELVVQREQRNQKLFAFLDELRTFDWKNFDEDSEGEDKDNVKMAAATAEWAGLQLSTALTALRKLSKEDFVLLSHLAGSHGLVYMRDSIVPQIVQLSDASVLREFALYLATGEQTEGSTAAADAALKQDIVSQVLKAAVSNMEIKLSPVDPSPAYSYYGSRPKPTGPEPSLDIAKTYFETCIALNFPDLAGTVVMKVADTSGHSVTDAQRRAKGLMLPFLTWIAEFLANHPTTGAIPGLEALQKSVITSIVDAMAESPTIITREEFGKLLQTVSLPGGMDMFVVGILPRLNSLASSESSAIAILEELQARVNQLILPVSYQGPKVLEVIASVTKKYAGFASIATAEAVITVMDRCIRMQAMDGVWAVLKRVLEPSSLKKHVPTPYTAASLANVRYGHPPFTGQGEQTYVDTVVLPLVGQLRQLALKHNMLDAFSPAFRMIARTYMKKVLGHPPTANPETRLAHIGRWACPCELCKVIRMFLVSKPEKLLILERIGAPKRNHVEKYLQLYVTSEGAAWETIRTSPQGIRVTKTSLLHDQSLWKANQKKAIQLLKDASPDEEERKRIYGDEYAEYGMWIKGVPAPARVAVQQQQQQQRRTVATGPSTGTAAVAGVRRPTGTQPNQTLPPAKRAKTSGTNLGIIDLTL